jgi:thiol-disulfide isomerase/thioredoxin
MSLPRALAIFVSFLALSTTARAADSSVDDLVKEGHWLKGKAWETQKVLLNKPAPELGLTDWVGKAVTAKDMKDKVVIIDCWATWCGPCKAAVPHTNEMAKKYADKGVLVLGACGGGQEERMADVAKQTKMEYPTARMNAETTKALKVQFWPTYIVVDRKGDIRAIGIQPDYVEKVVDAVLAEDPKK